MVTMKPLDMKVPILEQIKTDESPVVLVNIFDVAEEDISILMEAWKNDANWMKKQNLKEITTISFTIDSENETNLPTEENTIFSSIIQL